MISSLNKKGKWGKRERKKRKRRKKGKEKGKKKGKKEGNHRKKEGKIWFLANTGK